MKKLLCMLTVLFLLAGSAIGETDDAVRRAMQTSLCDAAGAEEGYLLETIAENAELLAWMNQWFVTITDDYIVLETAQDAYLAFIERENPVEALALVLACKAAYHDFVEEDIIVFLEWSGMDSIIIDDEEFGVQVETLQGMGYQQLSLENVLALRREVAASLGMYVTDSSFTYYDRYVKTDKGGYSPSKEVCFYCHGTGKCKTCGGDGLYRNSYTGDLMECTCYYGQCTTCDGTGWW